MNYTFDEKNGKFIPDTNFVNMGKKAVTFWNGNVWILNKIIFNKKTKKFTAEHKGKTISLKPSAILELKEVGQ